LTAVIAAQESERARIGQELHDGIGSTVASAKLLFSRMRHVADALPTEQDALLEKLMTTASQDVRSISHNLYPAVLSHYGLAEALQYLADVCNETGPLAVEIAVQYTEPMNLEQELALYRICQELVHNAQKHAAGATCLHITLHQTERHLTLSVADDGCGFPTPDPLGAMRGTGLRSIDLRTQLLGATLRRETAAGQGTCTIIQLTRSI
jgi:signal transduction histidine kinase